MQKIVGFVRKTGTFEKDGKKIDYDNFNVFYESDETQGVVGCSAGEVKCPVARLRIFGAKDLADCIGKECRLYVESNASRYKNSVPVVTTIIVGE